MDEGRERDNTSRKGGLPTLPGLYRSTIQPSRRGFYRIHVCEGEITELVFVVVLRGEKSILESVRK